jgi:hypothetical protein
VSTREICPVCDGHPERFGVATVLSRFEAVYLKCRDCGSVFAEDPTWLREAYETTIAERDIGLVSRNVTLAAATRRVLRRYFPDTGSYLDFGAGTGMFVRLMRDSGYDFRYFDEHGPNIYAPGLESDDPRRQRFDVVTAMEVLEHLEHPVPQLADVVSGSRALLATTEPLPFPAPAPGRWWYYALGTGQHITFYSQQGLDRLAERLGFVRTSAGSYHVFSRDRLSRRSLRLLVSERIGPAWGRYGARPSLLPLDYEALTGESLEDGRQ